MENFRFISFLIIDSKNKKKRGVGIRVWERTESGFRTGNPEGGGLGLGFGFGLAGFRLGLGSGLGVLALRNRRKADSFLEGLFQKLRLMKIHLRISENYQLTDRNVN
jgi:hypothetical protein